MFGTVVPAPSLSLDKKYPRVPSPRTRTRRTRGYSARRDSRGGRRDRHQGRRVVTKSVKRTDKAFVPVFRLVSFNIFLVRTRPTPRLPPEVHSLSDIVLRECFQPQAHTLTRVRHVRNSPSRRGESPPQDCHCQTFRDVSWGQGESDLCGPRESPNTRGTTRLGQGLALRRTDGPVDDTTLPVELPGLRGSTGVSVPGRGSQCRRYRSTTGDTDRRPDPSPVPRISGERVQEDQDESGREDADRETPTKERSGEVT